MLVRVFPETPESINIFDSDLDFTVQIINDFSNVLESDALPGPGTYMETETALDIPTQLLFTDQFGTVFYNTSMAQNVTLSVSGIPEPAGVGIGILGSLSVLVRRKLRGSVLRLQLPPTLTSCPDQTNCQQRRD